MKNLQIALILATMAATVCVAGVELANAINAELFIRFFGFASLLLVDVYVLAAILRHNDRNNK
ncbi:MAG: hypothetical protein HDT00_00280 [Bacteroidales bacterium]|nr:hypothetical protein [Bacteroidales bacterium]